MAPRACRALLLLLLALLSLRAGGADATWEDAEVDERETAADSDGTASSSCSADGLSSSSCQATSSTRRVPVYNHGMKEPIDLPCISAEASEEIYRKVLSLRELWDVRKPGSEQTVAQMPEYKEILDKLGLQYFTLGAFHNYMNHEEYEDKIKEIDGIMHETFAHLYKRVLEVIQEKMGEPVRAFEGNHFAFRIYDSSVLKSKMAREFCGKYHSAPHFDAVFREIDWPEGTQFNHTLSFTLPIKLPPGGHGLKIFHAYHDPYNQIWKDYEMNDIGPISIEEAFKIPSHIHKYHEGVLALHSGMELHAIPPVKVPLEGKLDPTYRITLQGWGVWTQDGFWNIFS